MSGKGEMEPPQDLLKAVVEAVVFAAGEPVPVKEIAWALGGVQESLVEEAVAALAEEYRGRGAGLQVERVAGGLRLATRAEVGPWVRQFFRQRNRTRLSPAGLETLAIVAYRQPITSPEIQAIRGVDSTASLKSLLEKKLVRILGKKKIVGSPLLYGTSRHFLVHFGLNALGDLPPIDEFNEILGNLEGVAAPRNPPGEATFDDVGVEALEDAKFDLSDEA